MPPARRAAELVVFREALWRNTAGVGAVASPVFEFLHSQCETSTGTVDPGHPIVCLESRDVGKSFFLVALQPHATAAAHFGHLIQRKDDHLPVRTDCGRQFSVDRRHGSRFVWRLQIEHLFAFTRCSEHIVLWHDETVAAIASNEEFAPALIRECGDHIGILKIDEQPDRLAMPSPAREL